MRLRVESKGCRALLLIVGAAFVVGGLASLGFHVELLWPTLPDPHARALFVEMGLVLIATTALTWTRRAPLMRLSRNSLALPLIIAFGFSLRSIWGYSLPFFFGWDTAHYVASAHFLSDKAHTFPVYFANAFSILFLHTKLLPWENLSGLPSREPFPYLLFATLAHFGVPDSMLPRIVIPLFSIGAVFPFYLITKKMYGRDAGLIAALALSAAPMEFRFMADLYRNVIGNFFMFTSLFLITNDRNSKYAYLAVISTTGLFLTYVPNVLILLLTIIVYSIGVGRGLLVKALRIMTVSCVLSLFPIWSNSFAFWAFSPLVTRTLLSVSTIFTVTLTGPDVLFYMPFLVPNLLFSIPAIFKRGGLDVASSLLAVLIALFLILGSINPALTFYPPDRILYYFEFPLILLAAKWISSMPRRLERGLVLAGWNFYQTMWLVSADFLYGPPPVWSFYQKLIPTMPPVGLRPEIHTWLVTSFIFATAVLILYWFWNEVGSNRNLSYSGGGGDVSGESATRVV